MRRVTNLVVVSMLAIESLVIGQGSDAKQVLASIRQALGGETKLAELKTLTASGRTTRVSSDGASAPADYEFAMELPDKFVKKDVIAVMMGNTISRTSGFNGAGLIEAVDMPPDMGHGMMVFRPAGGPLAAPGSETPEQREAQNKAKVLMAKQEFARLTLGIFAASTPAYPLEFSLAGQAEAPDGKADVIEVKGDSGFAAKLFADSRTHLPLMLTWMAKEPLVLNMGGPGPGRSVSGGGGGNTITYGGGQGGSATPANRDQMLQDIDARRKEAEAKLRVVEYRLYYGDFKDVSGIKVPHTIQRSIDGKPSEETTLEKVRVNAKIDAKKFETVK